MKKKLKFYEYPLLPFKYIALGLYAPVVYAKKTFYIFNHMDKFETLMPEEPTPVAKIKPKKIRALSSAKVFRPTAVVPVTFEQEAEVETLEIGAKKTNTASKGFVKEKNAVINVGDPKKDKEKKEDKPKWWQFGEKKLDARPASKIISPLAAPVDPDIQKRKEKGIKEREEFLKSYSGQDKSTFMKEAKDLRRKQLAEERMRLKIQKEAERKALKEVDKNKKYDKLQVLIIENDATATVRSKNKRLYRYLARDTEGHVLRGKFYATAKIEVHSFLMSEGYEVYSIELDPLGILNAQVSSIKLSTNDIIFFIAQLSTYLKAGIPLTDAVRLLSKQAPTVGKQTLYQAVVYELTMGASFSQGLERQGSSFPKLLINMIKTSELTGGLTEVLDDMEKYYQSTEQTKRQMISAMTYPTIVAAFSLVIIIFIMVYVIPNFVNIYEGASIKLPVITEIIINVSKFMKNNIIWIIIGIIAATFGTIFGYKNILPIRATIQYVLMHIPVVKNIIIYNEVTMFTKTFASLLHHDVYITDSMEILGNISNNEVFKYIIHNSVSNLQRGESISLAFKNQWAFPVVAYEMLLTGEKTGELAVMMDKVAEYYQQMHSNLVTQLKAFIEPIMIVTLTLVVGGVLLAVIVPMFNLYSQISSAS